VIEHQHHLRRAFQAREAAECGAAALRFAVDRHPQRVGRTGEHDRQHLRLVVEIAQRKTRDRHHVEHRLEQCGGQRLGRHLSGPATRSRVRA